MKMIKGPKIAFGRESTSDLENDLDRLGNLPIDYINYIPEQWRSSQTSRQEIEDLPGAVRRARALANQKDAKLSFGTDYVLLEKYGEEIAPLVDFFGIQLQRHQGETLEEFRRKTLEMVAIVRRGSKTAPILLQLSLAPPKLRTITKRNGEESKVLVRKADGTKLYEPLKAETVIEQIEAIKDLADGIALLYTKETKEEMKKVIRSLRQ